MRLQRHVEGQVHERNRAEVRKKTRERSRVAVERVREKLRAGRLVVGVRCTCTLYSARRRVIDTVAYRTGNRQYVRVQVQ